MEILVVIRLLLIAVGRCAVFSYLQILVFINSEMAECDFTVFNTLVTSVQVHCIYFSVMQYKMILGISGSPTQMLLLFSFKVYLFIWHLTIRV